jgi:Na+-driven multidrug efflux pump
MWVSLSRTILVYAPLAFILAKLLGLVGVFSAAFTANIVAGTVGFIWFRSAFRRQVAEERAVEAAQPG